MCNGSGLTGHSVQNRHSAESPSRHKIIEECCKRSNIGVGF
jgi:hypothetical protein